MVDRPKRHRLHLGIVQEIRKLQDKFLKEDPDSGLWYEIGDERALKKAGQAK